MIPNQAPEPFSIANMLSMPVTETEKMPSNPHVSPKAIPPRTSSSSAATVTTPPPKSIHRPVPEGEWISPKLRPAKLATTLGLAMMQPPNQPPNPERYAHEDLNFTAQRSWTEEKEKVVRGPFDYVISHPGKDFRAQLIGAFNAWLDVPADSLEIITRAVGMLHESSLLVDDVQDSSELRRGFPVAHNIFGVAQTINSANYIYFTALQELQKLNNPEAITMFAEELVNLHRGQGMDLFWRDTLTCPTEEDYLEMVGNKTGGLFRLGIKLMQAQSASTIDCVPLVNLIGLIFQIRDDYMNLSSKEYSHNKGMCEDLTEGKFSFPVIHSIRSNPSNLQLVSILKQKTSDTQVKRYAVAYMESTGTFEYTRNVLTVLIERARKLAEEIDQGQGLTKGIQKILDKMVVT
ncbi:isoprenoid synthase domain-containing protein [Ilyonectria robusta]|uniref:isoprenoid synthase domain-containing protein n=1 Tax=Ilyonectria robusta TaxID=1079257 RepID=UPI001E8E015B|nr:isoprenoid synthase domain-containing protein [Ilyonectria robusta]KAH8699552.1 isoprenoid synthase domain-containing protein [Ilyonectria robusta]